MSPEERELLSKTATLVEENNKILHSMRRSMRWASFMRILYWVVIIGSAVGTYYFIEPYLNTVLDLYGSISQTQQQLNGGADKIQDLLKNLKI